MLDEARRVAADIGGLLGVDVDADLMLAGRAAILDLPAPGRVSAGGATRVLATKDGWCAIALPRDDDLAALPAMLEVDAVTDPWGELSDWATKHSTAEVVKRTQLLDIAAAALGEADAGQPKVQSCGPGVGPRSVDGLLVADLSSLWAGPLCGQLLARAGATVVKVESPRRPDGTRRGDPAFFDWMNAGKLSYAVEFDNVRSLLGIVDVVIEGSRPAALRRRKLDAAHVPGPPGRIWLRISGYHDQPDRPAFGDDAAVAGGLVGEGPVFYGDAIADPLSGLEAARAIGESLRRGGGDVIDVAMAQVAARYAAFPHSVFPTVGRPESSSASPLGADNDTVRRLVAQRC